MARTRFKTICAPCYLEGGDVKRGDGNRLIIELACGVRERASRRREVGPRRRIHSVLRGGLVVIRALIGLLIVIAVVLFLAKVAVAGGIIGAIALILLVLVLFRVL
jgi:hypothetical protein